jgi:hypothetical protein
MQRAARLIVGSCSLATTSPWEFAGTDWLALLDEVVLAEAFRVAPDRSRGRSPARLQVSWCSSCSTHSSTADSASRAGGRTAA